MAKTLHNNSKRSPRSKNVIHSIAPDHIERIRFFEAAMNDKKSLQLSNELIEWCETNPNALFENEFLVHRKISQMTWHRWKKEYECLRIASDYVKTIFATRREMIAIKQDQKFVSGSMHLYSLIFEDDKTREHERKKELKKITEENKNDNTTKVIVLSQLDTGELVPISGKKNEEPLLPE